MSPELGRISIITRGGDEGTTTTIYGRDWKDAPIVEANGSVDSIQAVWAKSRVNSGNEKIKLVEEQLRNLMASIYLGDGWDELPIINEVTQYLDDEQKKRIMNYCVLGAQALNEIDGKRSYQASGYVDYFYEMYRLMCLSNKFDVVSKEVFLKKKKIETPEESFWENFGITQKKLTEVINLMSANNKNLKYIKQFGIDLDDVQRRMKGERGKVDFNRRNEEILALADLWQDDGVRTMEFIIPGENQLETEINSCRTAWRTMERRAITWLRLQGEENLKNNPVLIYLNRGSDILYLVQLKET